MSRVHSIRCHALFISFILYAGVNCHAHLWIISVCVNEYATLLLSIFKAKSIWCMCAESTSHMYAKLNSTEREQILCVAWIKMNTRLLADTIYNIILIFRAIRNEGQKVKCREMKRTHYWPSQMALFYMFTFAMIHMRYQSF